MIKIKKLLLESQLTKVEFHFKNPHEYRKAVDVLEDENWQDSGNGKKSFTNIPAKYTLIFDKSNFEEVVNLFMKNSIYKYNKKDIT